MKKYGWTLLFAAAILFLTSHITKENMGLSKEEVMDRAGEYKEEIDNVVQIKKTNINRLKTDEPLKSLEQRRADLMSAENILKLLKPAKKASEEEMEEKGLLEQFNSSTRFEIQFGTDNEITDDLLSHYYRHTLTDGPKREERIRQDYYRYTGGEYYYSDDMAPWEKTEAQDRPLTYFEVFDLIKPLAKRMEMEEGDTFYLFTLHDESRSDKELLEVVKKLGLEKELEQAGKYDDDLITLEEFENGDFDYTRLSLKFVIRRESMYMVTLSYELEAQDGDKVYTVSSNTDFEQFGILTKYAIPKELGDVTGEEE